MQASWRHSRPETSTFQWPAFSGYLQDTKKTVERRPFIRRALLFYKPTSVLGWILHTIFYVLAALILLWGIFSVISIYDPTIYQLEGREPLSLNEIVFIIILYWLLLLVPALAIRAWANYLDKTTLQRIEKGPSCTDGLTNFLSSSFALMKLNAYFHTVLHLVLLIVLQEEIDHFCPWV